MFYYIQGVAISFITGRIAWNTDYVNEGDYSIQIVTEDLHTGLKVVAEVLLRLTDPDLKFGSLPPRFIHLSEPLSSDIIYTMPGSSISVALDIWDDGQLEELLPFPVSPYPEELDADVIVDGVRGRLNAYIIFYTYNIIREEGTSSTGQASVLPIFESFNH